MSTIGMAKCAKRGFLASLIQKFRPLVIGNYHLTEGSQYASKPTLEESIGLPPKPKKPLSPYFRFMAANRGPLKAREPKLTLQEEIKRLSQQWQTVDDGEKQRLQDEYRKDLQVYVEKRARYDAKLTEGQRQQIKEARQERNEARHKRALRKRIRELGRPKRAPSAFLAFISKERKSNPQAASQSYRDWQQQCTSKWAAMSGSEKEVFFKESRKLQEKYKLELEEWENKMIKLGHIDVVRSHLVPEENINPKKK